MFEWFQGIALTAIQGLEHGNPLVFGLLFLLSSVMEIGIPVPFVQDAVLMYVGYEATGHLLPLAPVIMASLMAGRVFGGSILYWVARLLGLRFTALLGRRFPRILANAKKLGSKLGKRSPLAVALARLTPGLLGPSTIAAGVFRIRYLHFCVGVVISSVIPDIAELVSGLAIKSGFRLAGITPTPILFIIALVVVIALVWLSSWLWTKRWSRERHGRGSVDEL